MKKENWKLPRRIDKEYETLLMSLLRPITKEVLKAKGDMNKIKKILEKASKGRYYKIRADKISKRIATLIVTEDYKTWREAVKKSSKGAYINKLIKKQLKGDVKKRCNELLERNANIITTLPLNISREVIEHIASQNLKGKRSSDIAKEIESYFPQHTKAKSSLIARTETSKISSALTQARAEDIGVGWYVWRSSEDSIVRNSHRHMDGVIINYKHPPNPEKLDPKKKQKPYDEYNAGETFNCRCYAEPLISFNDVKWPCKVYDWRKDKIVKMTLKQFKEFGGSEFVA